MAAPSQFYVCNGQIPSETQDEGYTAFIDYMEKGAPNDKADGFELVARLHMPESGRVCVICKATDAKALFRHFMFWRSMFGLEFEYCPALTCAEMVEMQKEHNAKLDEAE
ncbi:MAG: hypothetical protein CMN96_07425 [Synechococcus sp. MED850]|jgi:hypothetical protein|nr:hypothetical protein [Synechococcus sp. MED850]